MTLVTQYKNAEAIAVVRQAEELRSAAFVALFKAAVRKLKQLVHLPSDDLRASA